MSRLRVRSHLGSRVLNAHHDCGENDNNHDFDDCVDAYDQNDDDTKEETMMTKVSMRKSSRGGILADTAELVRFSALPESLVSFVVYYQHTRKHSLFKIFSRSSTSVTAVSHDHFYSINATQDHEIPYNCTQYHAISRNTIQHRAI